jgi:hypothetical protein
MKKGRILGVLALVLLVVAGGIYWFVNKRRPPQAGEEVSVDRFGKEVDVKTLLGTLSVRPTLPQHASSSRYWVYVDGRIVDTKAAIESGSGSPQSTDILLLPGEYNVEVGVTLPNTEQAGSTFPFAFRTQKITVEAGQVESVRLSVEATDYDPPTALSPFITTGWEWFDSWVNRVDSEIQSFQKDQTQIALLEVFNALQQSEPVRPVVYINLPADNGGGREFDAEQIRLITAWLKNYRTGPLSPLPKEVVDRMPADIRARYDQVENAITNYYKYLNQFDAIAKKLEALEK